METYPKWCPFLAIAKPHEIGRMSPTEIDCWQEGCALWNEHLGVCGLIAVGHLRGIEICRREMGQDYAKEGF